MIRSGEHAVWDAVVGELREEAYWRSTVGMTRAYLEAYERSFREAVEQASQRFAEAFEPMMRELFGELPR